MSNNVQTSFYLVFINQTVGEETNKLKVVKEALNDSAAKRLAIEQVLHHELGEGAYCEDSGYYDCHSNIHYKAVDAIQLTAKQLEVLQELQF